MKNYVHNVCWQKLLRTALVMLLVAALCVSMIGCSKKDGDTDSTDKTGSNESANQYSSEDTDGADNTENTDPTDGTEEEPFAPVGTGDAASPAAKASYATTTAAPNDADMGLEVASFDGGVLTNSELNVYFWMEFYNFMNSEMGSYAAYLGLDTNSPLNLQESMAPIDENDADAGSMSWEQYFLQATMENYAYYKGLEMDANAQNFQLPTEYQEDLDNLEESVKEAAAEGGYETIDQFVQASFGSGTTFADYASYMKTYITAYAYYETVLMAQCTPTDEEVTAYFDENAETYAEKQLTKTDLNDINIRHILIKPAESYTVDSDGDGTNDSYTDEEWAAAETEANEIYTKWQQDPTEENFAALAKEYTDDGNGEQGGLYENVYPGQMVTEFNDWCFDAARVAGDSGIIKTSFGYHVMYFSGKTDRYSWFETAKDNLIYQELGELSAHVAGQYEITFNCMNIVLCDVVSANVATE